MTNTLIYAFLQLLSVIFMFQAAIPLKEFGSFNPEYDNRKLRHACKLAGVAVLLSIIPEVLPQLDEQIQHWFGIGVILSAFLVTAFYSYKVTKFER